MDPINVPGILSDEPQTSGSAETIRQLPLHIAARLHTADVNTSTPSSPRLSLPGSPVSSVPSPSSPSGESISSLPSVSSSFLFSSVPASPPHLGLHHGPHGHELGDNSLIIPSLTLPSPVRRPTLYGQALGEVRLLVLGGAGCGAEAVAQMFAEEECEDIVEVGQWEEVEIAAEYHVRARVLRLSTDWIEYRDAHGLEKHEPSRNVEVVLLQDYGPDSDLSEVLRSTLSVVHAPFSALVPVLHPHQSPNVLLANLLASSASPLYTAMAIVPSNCVTSFEHKLISELSAHVPLVVLPDHQPSSTQVPTLHSHQSPYSRRPSPQEFHPTGLSDALRAIKLASIHPQSAHALRTCILRSPEALSALRLEAAERFMRWREVERAVGHVLGDTTPSSESDSVEHTPVAPRVEDPGRRRWPTGSQRWNKARWEEEWEGSLATDVAKTLRARRVKGMGRRSTVRAPARPRLSPKCADVAVETTIFVDHDEAPSNAHFDPLHLPSLLAFSISLFGPLKTRIARIFTPTRTNTQIAGLGAMTEARGRGLDAGGTTLFLVGAFCAGVGVGVLLSRGIM